MTLIINPGSSIGQQQEGFTNTHKQAKLHAYKWFYKQMLEKGFTDITVIDTKEEVDGRWKFIFKHDITGKEVELEVHGIDNMDKYTDKYIFNPKVYWNGSSVSDPELEQFANEGFKPIMTYAPKESGGNDE
jgi:hypothetical protein